MEIQQLRDKIDDIDSQILELFLSRMQLCRDVADYKRQHNMPVLQSGREQQIIDRIKALTGDPSLEAGTAALFTTIMDISKILQNRQLLSENPDYNFSLPDFSSAARIGCQGTSGANSETAARLIFGDKQPISTRPSRTFSQLCSPASSITEFCRYIIPPPEASTAHTTSWLNTAFTRSGRYASR